MSYPLCVMFSYNLHVFYIMLELMGGAEKKQMFYKLQDNAVFKKKN